LFDAFNHCDTPGELQKHAGYLAKETGTEEVKRRAGRHLTSSAPVSTEDAHAVPEQAGRGGETVAAAAGKPPGGRQNRARTGTEEVKRPGVRDNIGTRPWRAGRAWRPCP
jgi:hypothetical protein